MKVLDDIGARVPERDVVLTIGSFDGVHRGHQQLVRDLVTRARATDSIAAALTFTPHPRVLLNDSQPPHYLCLPQEREHLLASLGLDLLVVQPFTIEFAHIEPGVILKMLVDELRMRELWVGPDFALGSQRRGDIAFIERAATPMGFDLRVVEPLVDDDEPISSTRIRRVLMSGNVAEASRLLGRRYTLTLNVVSGHQRGRRIGFRTANLRLDPLRATPADGVYAVMVLYRGRRYQGVANIGNNPSFGEEDRLLEVHLLDFEGDLYERTLSVQFIERLRGEVKFDSLEALKVQIQQDIEHARIILARPDALLEVADAIPRG